MEAVARLCRPPARRHEERKLRPARAAPDALVRSCLQLVDSSELRRRAGVCPVDDRKRRGRGGRGDRRTRVRRACRAHDEPVQLPLRLVEQGLRWTRCSEVGDDVDVVLADLRAELILRERLVGTHVAVHCPYGAPSRRRSGRSTSRYTGLVGLGARWGFVSGVMVVTITMPLGGRCRSVEYGNPEGSTSRARRRPPRMGRWLRRPP